MRLEPAVTGTGPFDAVAADYDLSFSETRLGQWLRQMVRERLDAVFEPGDWVLELGCGTGEDAVWLAQRGVAVTATDASAAMIEVARHKAAAAGVVDAIDFECVDLHDLERWVPGRTFDGVVSNFGALNCLPDLGPLAQALARWLRPGASAVLVIMGPCCPWEIAWHLLHGQVRAALRRFRGAQLAHVGQGAWVPVWYPTPRRVRSDFEPFFRPTASAGIGVLLPPTYLRHLVDRWPDLFARLAAWERSCNSHFPCTWLNDHYLLALERRRHAQ
jgi:ubiquinone/menaquinone biosynthesis C-methylase UbiE